LATFVPAHLAIVFKRPVIGNHHPLQHFTSNCTIPLNLQFNRIARIHQMRPMPDMATTT
jgi:hypothetical protein